MNGLLHSVKVSTREQSSFFLMSYTTVLKKQRWICRDVSFQAIAWIQAFMKSKFLHFYLFHAVLEAFSPDSHPCNMFFHDVVGKSLNIIHSYLNLVDIVLKYQFIPSVYYAYDPHMHVYCGILMGYCTPDQVCDCCARWKKRYVSFRLHSREPNYCF